MNIHEYQAKELLRSYGIPLMKVAQVIRDSNRDVGGRVVEMTETEYMVRGKGYLRGRVDIEMLVVGNCLMLKQWQDPALARDYKSAFELD